MSPHHAPPLAFTSSSSAASSSSASTTPRSMKLTAIVLLGLALLLLVNLNGCSVESRLIGHHPPGQGHHLPGQGHHPPGQGHHHDHDGDGDDDGGHKHGRRHHHHHHHAYDGFSLYVFGDSFVDNGNLPKWDDNWPVLSRQWYYPYAGDGRFSNQLVQSDFIAKILGLSKAPAAHALGGYPSRIGVNFAVGGSGVFKVPQQKPTLKLQILNFMSEIVGGNIGREHLKGKSVALVAVSGNDYNRVGVDTSGFGDIKAYVNNVTSEIVDNVVRLQDIGVQKVLVNNLYPLGCAPSQSRPLNYTACEPQGNQGAALHNHYLAEKLADMDGVLILDLSTAFSNIIHPSSGATDSSDSDDDTNEAYNNFEHRLKPCCYGFEHNDYCGLRTEEGRFNPPITINRYRTCSDPDVHFFFDEMHPTQAGWAAVMGQLEGDVKEFLEIEDQE